MVDWKTLHQQTRTPNDTGPGYDWRHEPWVNDEGVRALSYYIAYHVLTAMSADGDGDTEEYDNVVLSLLMPEMTERIWKSESDTDVVDNRVACAAAMGIDKLISKWMEEFRSVDAEGMPCRTPLRTPLVESRPNRNGNRRKGT